MWRARRRTIVIGVTGPIGAGKTRAVGLFRRAGAVVVDADLIGKGVTGSPSVLKTLTRWIGPQAQITRGTRGTLNTRVVADFVFGDSSGRRLARFNRLVRPTLVRQILVDISKARKSSIPLVALDAALLPDWPSVLRQIDFVVVVTAPRAIRQRRIIARGLTPAEGRRRIESEIPLYRYRRIANLILRNPGSIANLGTAVRACLLRLQSAPDA